jgi:hypothetical protein
MPSTKKRSKKSKEDKGEFKFTLLGIEIKFTTILAGKILFMTTVSLLFLYHCFFILKVPLESAIPPFILVVATFIITLKFGCNPLPSYHNGEIRFDKS